MNELKSNNQIVMRGVRNGTSSNVSEYVKREEKIYVRRYSMPKRKLSSWIYNYLDGNEEAVLHPTTRGFKAQEAISDIDRRKKDAVKFSLSFE